MEIKHDQHNANKGTKRGKELLNQSLRELGGGRSILLDKDGNIIAGNKTYEEAQKLGLKVRVIETGKDELVAVQRGDLDLNDGTGDARRLAYLDNRVSELDLAWDEDQFALDLAAGMDLYQLGFQENELFLIIGEPEKEIDAKPEFDKADELRNKWNVQAGQMWKLGNHYLICGDCTAADVVERVLQGSKFDLLCTDPPYGVNVHGGEGGEMVIANDSPEDVPDLLLSAFRLAVKWAEKKAAFYIAGPHGPQSHEFSKAILAAGMDWKQTLVWSKNNIVLGRSDYQQKHEIFFYGNFGHGRVWNGGRKQKSVTEDQQKLLSFIDENTVQVMLGTEMYAIQGDNLEVSQIEPDVIRVEKPQKNELHPTIKPMKLIRRMIRNSTERGAVVYDPFSGSGTTILACENDSRRCCAVELLPKYAAVNLQRWFDATGVLPILLDNS